VLGAGGQVGQELVALARARGLTPLGLTRAEADITDADAIATILSREKPRLIVNAAAFTAVDKAESEPDSARRINADGPGMLGEAAREAGVPVLHISTDYVFDGTKATAYDESDSLAPLGVYGATKAEGEARLAASGARHVILRTAWVFGPYGANFLKTMLRLARERDTLRVVADQRGCPTATIDIAEAILAVDDALAKGQNLGGIYHFAGTGATTWHGFAEAIVAAQAPFTGKSPPVAAIGTADYPTPARRPANSELDSSAFARAFGTRAAPWRQRVTETVERLLDTRETSAP
jgi:dTDP-4-dehydrorhamnose reductase